MSLLEVLVASSIFLVIFLASSLLFHRQLLSYQKIESERKILQEAQAALEYFARYLRLALVNDLEGRYRIGFQGEKNYLRFIAPFSESETGSDLCKFGFYQEDDKLKVQVIRINQREDDFSFPDNFSGAQILAENISQLAFRYYGHSTWYEQWESRQDVFKNELPSACEIKITCYHPSKLEGRIEKKDFFQIVYLVNSSP